MNEEKLQNIHRTLSNMGAIDNDYTTWKANMTADPAKQANIHKWLVGNGYIDNDLDTWKNNVLGTPKPTTTQQEVQNAIQEQRQEQEVKKERPAFAYHGPNFKGDRKIKVSLKDDTFTFDDKGGQYTKEQWDSLYEPGIQGSLSEEDYNRGLALSEEISNQRVGYWVEHGEQTFQQEQLEAEQVRENYAKQKGIDVADIDTKDQEYLDYFTEQTAVMESVRKEQEDEELKKSVRVDGKDLPKVTAEQGGYGSTWKDESKSVTDFGEMYNKYGFTFSQTSSEGKSAGDRLYIESWDGKRIYDDEDGKEGVRVDRWGKANNQKAADHINAFLQEHAIDVEAYKKGKVQGEITTIAKSVTPSKDDLEQIKTNSTNAIDNSREDIERLFELEKELKAIKDGRVDYDWEGGKEAKEKRLKEITTEIRVLKQGVIKSSLEDQPLAAAGKATYKRSDPKIDKGVREAIQKEKRILAAKRYIKENNIDLNDEAWQKANTTEYLQLSKLLIGEIEGTWEVVGLDSTQKLLSESPIGQLGDLLKEKLVGEGELEGKEFELKGAHEGVRALMEEITFDDVYDAAIKRHSEDEAEAVMQERLKDTIEDFDGGVFTKSEYQKVLEAQAKERGDALSEEKEMAMRKHNILEVEINDVKKQLNTHINYLENTDIIAEIEKIKGRDFVSGWEVEGAQEEIDSLVKEYNYHLNGYREHGGRVDRLLSLARSNAGIIEDLDIEEEDLKVITKALGKNYQDGTGIALATANGLVDLLQGLEYSVAMISEAVDRGSKWIMDSANIEDPTLKAFLTGTTTLLSPLAMYHDMGSGPEGEPGWRQKMHKSIDGWQENMAELVEQPIAYDSIDSFSDFTEWAGQMLGGQIPNLALMYATGGASLYVMGASSAGSKFADYQEQKELFEQTKGLYGKDISFAEMFLYSSGVGLAEALSEKVTLGQMKTMKGALKSVGGRQGLAKYLRTNVFNKQALLAGGVDIFQEGGSEMLASMAENMADYYSGDKTVSLYDNLEEAFVSGVLISTSMKSMPVFKQLMSPFKSQETSTTMDANFARIQEIQNMMTDQNLSKEVEDRLSDELAQIIQQNTELVTNDIKRVDLLSNSEKRSLLDIESDNRQLQQAAQEIYNDTGLTDQQKAAEVSKIEDIYNRNLTKKQEILDKHSVELAKEKYAQTMESIRDRADEVRKAGGPSINVQEGNTKDFETFLANTNDNLMEQTYREGLAVGMQEVLADPNATTEEKAQAQSYLDQLQDGVIQEIPNMIAGQASRYGVMVPVMNEAGEITSYDMFVNKETSLEDGMFHTGAHEFVHATFYNTLKQDGNAALALAGPLMEILESDDVTIKDQDTWNARVQGYRAEQQGEEAFAVSSEMMMDNDIEFNDNAITKVKDIFRRFSQNYLGRDIKFDTKEDVKNFIKDYHHSIKNNVQNKALTRMIVSGAKGKLIDDAKAALQKKDADRADRMAFSKNVDQAVENNPDLKDTFDTFTQNEDGSKKFNSKAEWRSSETFWNAYTALDGKHLDGLIRAGVTAKGVPSEAMPQFVSDVKVELQNRLEKNFDPSMANGSLFGWLTGGSGKFTESILYRAKGDVMVKYGVEPKTTPIERVTETGEVITAQIAAETDAATQILDNADLSGVQKPDIGVKNLMKSLSVNDTQVATIRKINPKFSDIYRRTKSEIGKDLKRRQAEDARKAKENNVPVNEALQNMTVDGLQSQINSAFAAEAVKHVVRESKVNSKDAKTYKGVKKLVVGKNAPLRQVLDVVGSLYGIPSSKIIEQKDLDTAQRKSAQNHILKTTDTQIASLPEGHNASGKATGVPPTLLNAVNPKTGKPDLLYEKRAKAKFAKTGSAQGLALQYKQKNIDRGDFQSLFGIVKGQPNANDTSVDGAIRNLAIQNTMLAANQALREIGIEKGVDPLETINIIGDGKSDLFFSQPAAAVRYNGTADIGLVVQEMLEIKDLRLDPQQAVELAAQKHGLQVADFGNAAGFINSVIKKHQIKVTEKGAYKSIIELSDVKQNSDVIYSKNWNDFLKTLGIPGLTPLDKTNPKDRAIYKRHTAQFLTTLPSAALTNVMFFNNTFQSGTRGDFFSTSGEVKALALAEMNRRRKDKNFVEPKTNIKWDKVSFQSKFAGKIQNISIKFGDPTSPDYIKNESKRVQTVIRAVNEIRNKQKSDPVEVKKAEELMYRSLMEYMNTPKTNYFGTAALAKTKTVDKADALERQRFVVSTLQDATNRSASIFKGSANFTAMSMTPSNVTKFSGKKARQKVMKDYNLSKKAARLINNPKDPKVKAKERAVFEAEIQNKLKQKAKENGISIKELRQQIRGTMQKRKSHHGEHDLALLLTSTNLFKSMIDGNFDTVYPKVSKYYTQTALNEDFRILVDGLFGKTGNAEGYSFGMMPAIRFVAVDPKLANDIVLFDYGATLNDVIAAELALKELKGEFMPLVKQIKEAAGDNLNVINKNKEKISKNVDLKNARAELIASAYNEVSNNQPPQRSSVDAVHLTNKVNNIDNINKIKKNAGAVSPLVTPEMTMEDQLSVVDNLKQAKLQFSKSKPSPKPKGASFWDFDDTLARTKSGVRAKIPNTDGTPKPGRKVIFLAGGAGSGKSSVVKKVGLQKQGYKLVNSDISLEWLKKNHGLPASMKDYTREQLSMLGKLQGESRRIAKRKKAKYQGNGDGVIIDGTGASVNVMNKQVKEFKDKGYDVAMMFVETSEDVSVDRNAKRKERSLREDIVRKNHKKVMANKEAYSELFGQNFNLVNTDSLALEDALPQDFVGGINNFTNSYENRRLDAEEFAAEGADIVAQGGTFDFAEFDTVVEGEKGPMFNQAKDRVAKYGDKSNFVLTARPHAAQPHIHAFLKSQGINIPIENVITLENSTPEAKALKIAEMIGDQGYNDIYFADDALINVNSVQDVLNQFDIKGKSQQAKLQFSKDAPKKLDNIISEVKPSVDAEFNQIMQDVFGVGKERRFTAAKAKVRGAKVERFKFFIPPSAEDFAGLCYSFFGKGKQGDKHHAWFKEHLFDPFSRGIRAINMAKQNLANDFSTLKKMMPKVRKILRKDVPGTEFSHENAVRVYNWNKAGYDMTEFGLSKTDQAALIKAVEKNPDLQAFAENVSAMVNHNADGIIEPTQEWLVGNIRSDLDYSSQASRENFLAEWKANKDIIFSPANLNKIQATLGDNFREALEDMLYAMENGTSRPYGSNKLVNNFMNWINGSIGAVMNFNTRSGVLQTLSTVNFINWGDNNIFKAAKAFGNQKQFWSDFANIFNSPYLKQRRTGLKQDVNANELAQSIKDAKNPAVAAIGYFLKKGFVITQIMDSFAISMGGASMYRNRIKTYLEQGMTQKDAEAKAWNDFMEVSEETQQSARPDRVSQQQRSALGKLVLAFQNTPMQYARLTKKAILDLVNNRGDAKTNVSKILYYGAAQNLIFYSLQSAMFGLMFGGDDEEDEEFFDSKKERIVNSMIDGVLRGMGVAGAVVSTAKNMILEFMEQEGKRQPDHAHTLIEMLNLSPPIGIKARKLYGATQTWEYNEDVIKEMGWDIDNPIYSSVFGVVEATTNIPLQRMYSKLMNVREAMNSDHELWQRIAMFLGWSQWNLGIKNEEIEQVKQEIKEQKTFARKEKARIKKEEQQQVIQDDINAQVEEEKKLFEEGKLDDPKCNGVTSKGGRCGLSVAKPGDKCTIHESKPQRTDGKKVRCKGTRSDGGPCGIDTSNKSGYCFYHD